MPQIQPYHFQQWKTVPENQNEDLSMLDDMDRLTLEVLMARLDDCFVAEEEEVNC
jgi:hypothetical protein